MLIYRIANLNKLTYSKLYIGEHTYKYTKAGEIVKDISIEDVVKLETLCNTDKISIHVYWVVPDENGIDRFVPNN